MPFSHFVGRAFFLADAGSENIKEYLKNESE